MASLAPTSQDSGPTAEASLLAQEFTERQQLQSQLGSQPVSLSASAATQRQGLSSTGMLKLAQHSSQTRQAACLGSLQVAGLQQPQGSSDRQSFDSASADRSVQIQSKRSCASSGMDVDELVDADTRWEEVKGNSIYTPFCEAFSCECSTCMRSVLWQHLANPWVLFCSIAFASPQHDRGLVLSVSQPEQRALVDRGCARQAVSLSRRSHIAVCTVLELQLCLQPKKNCKQCHPGTPTRSTKLLHRTRLQRRLGSRSSRG